MEEQGRNRKELHADIQEHPPSNRFSAWEEQLLIETDGEQSFEARLTNYQQHTDQKLWLSFQTTASAIAQLYRERLQQHEGGWMPFQNSAASATNLYKESVEISRTTRDLAIQCGFQRRNKELISWARKRKRNIRREDLLSFLCGRSPHRTSGGRPSKHSPALPKPDHVTHELDLRQFHEAVSLQGLSGAMAGISVRGHPGSPSQRQRTPPVPGLDPPPPEGVRHRRTESSPSTSSMRMESRKRNPSSDSSSSDCPNVSKKPRK